MVSQQERRRIRCKFAILLETWRRDCPNSRRLISKLQFHSIWRAVAEMAANGIRRWTPTADPGVLLTLVTALYEQAHRAVPPPLYI